MVKEALLRPVPLNEPIRVRVANGKTVGKKTHTMSVVQAFKALHAASSADKHKHAVSLQAMQVSVDG